MRKIIVFKKRERTKRKKKKNNKNKTKQKWGNKKRNELTQEDALKNAPQKDSDYFKVPTVLKK